MDDGSYRTLITSDDCDRRIDDRVSVEGASPRDASRTIDPSCELLEPPAWAA
jgi:hypothetical protein